MQEKRTAKNPSSFSDTVSWFMYYFLLITSNLDVQGQIPMHPSSKSHKMLSCSFPEPCSPHQGQCPSARLLWPAGILAAVTAPPKLSHCSTTLATEMNTMETSVHHQNSAKKSISWKYNLIKW